MKHLGFIICTLLMVIGNAQLIDNKQCNAFSDEPFFDSEFIRQNKIKSINGEIRTKGNLEVIKDSKLVSKYEFDSTGKLVLQLGSFNTMGSKDTTFHNYLYDEKDRLVVKRTNDAYGFFSYTFLYDSLGRMLSKTYCREENSGKDRYHFELGKQYIIVKETYSYLQKDSVLIKSVYNNHDRVYQKTTHHYNEFGLLDLEENQFVINKKKSQTKFTYSEQLKVSEKKHLKDAQKPEEFEKWEYQYDEFGNLSYIDYHKNGVHITHQEVLYDKSTFLLKALLIQDVASNFITIVKFTTEFFD